MKKPFTNGLLDKNIKSFYRSEAHLRAVFDSATTAYLFLDNDLKIHSFNRSALEWAKREMGNILEEGKNFISLLPLKDREISLQNFHKALNGEELKFETEYTRHNGTTSWFLFRMTAIKGINDDVLGICVKAVNINERKLAEANLKKKEKFYRALIENSTDMKGLISSKGVITYGSASITRFLGYAQEEFVGKKGYWLIHPEDIPRLKKIKLKAIARPGESFYLQARVKHKNDSWRWCEGTVTNHMSNPDIDAIVVNFRDVTKNREAEDQLRSSEERYRLVAENPILGISWASIDGLVMYANEALCRMLEYSRDEMIGMYFGKVTHDEDMKWEVPLFEKLLKGEIGYYQVEKRFITKTGRLIWAELNLTRVKDHSGEIYFIGVVQDISARKNAESELQAFNASLERRVVKRTVQLEQANKELEAFNFLVSHDLRSPLRAIEIFVTLLKRKKQNIQEAEFVKYLSNIEECSKEMSTLIKHLLEFSMIKKKVGKQQLNMSRIKMDELIHEVFNEIRLVENNKKIKLEVKNAPDVYADRILMKLVLTNLLSNAVKYSSRNEKILVEINGWETNGFVEYYVKDNGVGFDPKHAHKLFKPFSRLHSSGEFKGTGAGLAIVEKIISFHNGHVNATSEPGSGATFYFYLPVNVSNCENDKDGHCGRS